MRISSKFSMTAAVAIMVTAAALGGCGSDGDETQDELSTKSTSDPDLGANAEESGTVSEAEDPSGDPEADDDSTGLIGRWVRDTASPCAAAYPISMEFRETVYLVELDPSVAPAIDSGEYMISSDSIISLTAPNDAMVEFRFKADARRLTITDSTDCEISYLRAP